VGRERQVFPWRSRARRPDPPQPERDGESASARLFVTGAFGWPPLQVVEPRRDAA